MADTFRFGGRTHLLSDWLSAARRPWEPGVYERAGAGGRYSCWTGAQWMQGARTPRDAAMQRAIAASEPTAWRGLRAPSGQRCLTCKGHSVLDLGVHPDTAVDLISECPDC